MASISALQCPSCGASVRATQASCKSCGVGLSFNYAELFGVKEYKVTGRDKVLDAILLSLAEQEAEKHNFEITPALADNSIFVYVRHLETGKLVEGGRITAHSGVYFVSGNSGYFHIKFQTKLSQGGRIYLISFNLRDAPFYIAEDEEKLIEISDVQNWARGIARSAIPRGEQPIAIKKFSLFDRSTWFRKSSVSMAEKALT